MSSPYLRILISAASKDEADTITDLLIKRKLIAGGLITNGPSRYWWKNEIAEKIYYNVSAFTKRKHKDTIIAEVKQVSKDEVPIIAFFEMDGNEEFLKWIDENIV